MGNFIELLNNKVLDYETIHFIERKSKNILIFLKQGFDLNDENIVDIEIYQLIKES